MNLLTKLLFSPRGKICRADYIYALAYSLMLFFVCTETIFSGQSWQLFGGGRDTAGLLQYIFSAIGIIVALWIYAVTIVKRCATLEIDKRWALLAIFFTPLLIFGLQRDSKKMNYNGNVSILDHIFFYILIFVFLVCVIGLYDISFTAKTIFVVVLIIAAICLHTFDRDVAPYKNKNKIKYEGFDVWVDLFFVLIIVFFIRSFILSPFQIIGPSMESTFHGGSIRGDEYGDGEFILVDKMTYQITTPKRGDVVVFSPRIGPEKRYLIKRIIGLPGDTVRIENGYVSIATPDQKNNFIRLDESLYLEEKFGNTCLNYSRVGCGNEKQDFVVPEGRYFLMGDNRPQSLDARKCFHSSGCTETYKPAQFVPISAISGKVALSLGHFDLFEQFLMPNSYVPFPKLGTLKQVVDFRWNNIKNTHTYSELSPQ